MEIWVAVQAVKCAYNALHEIIIIIIITDDMHCKKQYNTTGILEVEKGIFYH